MHFKLIVVFQFCLVFLASADVNFKDTCIARIEAISGDKEKAINYDQAAEIAWTTGDYAKTIKYTERGLELCKAGEYRLIEASLLNNRGIAYDYLGDYSSALKDFFKALRITEKQDDQYIEAYILSNIGLIYSNQKLGEKALSYHTKALKIRKEINDLPGISASLNNIAIVYEQQEKQSKAIEYYQECIRIDKQLGDERGLADDYNNIGICYLGLRDFDKAMSHFKEALDIRLRTNNPLGVTGTYTNIASVYYDKGEYTNARDYFLLALPIAKKIGSKETLRYTYEYLVNIEDKLLDSASAYNYYKLFIAYRDSISNSENARIQTELELSYNFDKEKEVTRLEQEKKDDQARMILYAVSSGLVLIIIFSILLFRRWKLTQGQKAIIEEKNKLVELKNEEILDSITYAKRIQKAILPSSLEMNELLPEHFITYIPKDIVAGDFYWCAHHNNKTFIAVADCTGHGVPGAMMSVVCNNALNRSIREYNLTDPALILDNTRRLVIEEFEKSDEGVKDGMDIALCTLEGSELHYSGAYNPLWLIRNSELMEYKADKQPIGKFDNMKPFTGHRIQLQKGDTFYLFSDGYADQFGGPQGKKFKANTLRTLLLATQDKSMAEQASILTTTFKDWLGELDQIDDVCVIGVRI